MSSMIHPQFGDIFGLSTAEWLARFDQGYPIKNTIVLATDQRTGSEWLCQLMASTGRLGIPSEYLNTEWMRKFLRDYPDECEAQMALAHRTGTSSNGIFSIKIHIWHFDRIRGNHDRDSRLGGRRRDLLRQAVSLLRASQTRAYHAFTAKQAPENYNADIILGAIRTLALNQARWDMFFARNDIAPIELIYEVIQDNPTLAIQSIGEAVGEVIDISEISDRAPLEIQRDDITEEWIQRFKAEKSNLNSLDQLPVGI